MSAERSDDLLGGDASIELSSNRTSLSFERTRMSADSTLMSVVRTSLSLIGFGFTINQVFSKASALIPRANETGRNLGLALLILGLALLVMGIISHSIFDRSLGERRDQLYGKNLLRHAAAYHATPTYITAVALLLIGLAALASVAFRLF